MFIFFALNFYVKVVWKYGVSLGSWWKLHATVWSPQCVTVLNLVNQTDVDSITGTDTAVVLEFAYFVSALLLTEHHAMLWPYCGQYRTNAIRFSAFVTTNAARQNKTKPGFVATHPVFNMHDAKMLFSCMNTSLQDDSKYPVTSQPVWVEKVLYFE